MDMNSWSNSQQLQDRIIWVRSQAEAENYPMVPNATMQFWDIYQPVVYRKMTDAYGRTSLFETYDLKLRDSQMPAPQQRPIPMQNQQPTPNEYVSIDVFNGLAAQVGRMNEMLVDLVEASRQSTPAASQNQNQQQNHSERRKDGNR